jgi:hypothetical protein
MDMTRDEEHLQLLSTFHYVVGGLAALFALFPGVYLLMGLALIFIHDQHASNGPPPAVIGWVFVVIGVVCITLGMTLAAFVLATGRNLARHRHYTFCMVMACIECLFMPFGTVLGVFTIVVLVREPVKQLFGVS